MAQHSRKQACDIELHPQLHLAPSATRSMQADAVGDSTQGHAAYHISAAQAASSDDCSAVNLEASTAAQDGATSTPAQHAQHGAAQQSKAQQEAAQEGPLLHLAPADDPRTGFTSRRSQRKRKQPDRSLPPSNQVQTKSCTSQPDGIQANGADVKDRKGSMPGSLFPVLSRRKGKRKGSKASEGQSSLEASGGSIRSLPSSAGTAAGRKAKAKNKFDAVIGRTIDIPGDVFGVDVPDLYYRGTVLKKDNAHPGSVVVRFIEDGSRYWFPVTEVERFLGDMQSSGRDAASDTIGQGSHDFAAQVLAGTLAAKKKASGMTSSSATAGSHEVEVSSGVHSKRAQARSPSRFSRDAPLASINEQTSSLQALAAVADSGTV